MPFPVIPMILAFALYVLHDSETQSDEKVNDRPGPAPNDDSQKERKVNRKRKNKIVEIPGSAIDDKSKTVPDSAPHSPENSVPTDPPPISELSQ